MKHTDPEHRTAEDASKAHEEPTPTSRYILVWLGLLILTFSTTAIAKIDLGALNVYVALTIAVAKALLVILFFMHVNHSHGITRVYVAAGFFWLGILLFLTMTDYLSRGWAAPPRTW